MKRRWHERSSQSDRDFRLRHAVINRQWSTVIVMLGCAKTDDDIREWAVEEAIRHADADLERILPHCTRERRSRILHLAVTRRFWSAVAELLRSSDIPGARRSWAVQEAIEHADDEHLESVLPHCADAQVDAALTEAVNRHLWLAVTKLLWRTVSYPVRAWAVEEALKHAVGEHLESVLPRCTDAQLDRVLSEALTEGWWECVKSLWDRELSDDQRQYALTEVSKRAPADVLKRVVALGASVSVPDEVLQNLLDREQWAAIAQMLTSFQRLSDQQRQWIVKNACKCARGNELLTVLRTVRTDDLWETLLPDLLQREQWGAVLILHFPESCPVRSDCHFPCSGTGSEGQMGQAVLQASGAGSEGQIGQAIIQASKHADQETLIHFATRCPESLLDGVVTETVRRGLWGAVYSYFSRPISDSVRKRAVDEAIRCGGDSQDVGQIISQCTDEQLGPALSAAATRRFWSLMEGLFGRLCYMLSSRQEALNAFEHEAERAHVHRALKEAAKYAGEDTVLRLVLHHHAHVDADVVLAHTVGRGFWRVVPVLLEKRPDVSEARRRLAVEEAVKRADGVHLKQVLLHCIDDQVDAVVMEAVKRRWWDLVVELLPRTTDEAVRRLVVEDVMKKSSRFSNRLLHPLLPLCTEDQVEPALRLAADRGLWGCAASLLARCVSETTKRWMVEEASKRSSESELLHIIPFSMEDQADSIISTAIERHHWNCMDKVMQLGRVSESRRKRILMKAYERAKGRRAVLPLNERCRQEDVVDVLQILLRKGFTRPACRLLERFTPSQLRTCVQTSSTQLSINDLTIQVALLSGHWALLCFALDNMEVSRVTRREIEDTAFLTIRDGQYSNSEFPRILQCCRYANLLAILREYMKGNIKNLPATGVIKRICNHSNQRAVKMLLLLVVGTQNRHHDVAECIKQGTSTHQAIWEAYRLTPLTVTQSVLGRAVQNKDYKTVRMLYDAGACWNQQLTVLRRVLETRSNSSFSLRSDLAFNRILNFLRTVASRPRSLKSLCRLVISHHLGVGDGRQERVKQLSLPEPLMDYVLFSDVVSSAEIDCDLDGQSPSRSQSVSQDNGNNDNDCHDNDNDNHHQAEAIYDYSNYDYEDEEGEEEEEEPSDDDELGSFMENCATSEDSDNEVYQNDNGYDDQDEEDNEYEDDYSEHDDDSYDDDGDDCYDDDDDDDKYDYDNIAFPDQSSDNDSSDNDDNGGNSTNSKARSEQYSTYLRSEFSRDFDSSDDDDYDPYYDPYDGRVGTYIYHNEDGYEDFYEFYRW